MAEITLNIEKYDQNLHTSLSFVFQDTVINEDEEVGPLIPPPQGFRGPSARPGQGRPLSQSIPQVRMKSCLTWDNMQTSKCCKLYNNKVKCKYLEVYFCL